VKIHFSNVNFNSQSGPNSFACRLANEIANKEGYEIVKESEDYDIFLCFIEPASTPKEGSKLIHRLDGIWFKPEEFNSHNKNIKWCYKHADHVIWQSMFDKEMTSHHWGIPKKGSVIHNGIRKINFQSLHPEVEKIKNSFDRIFVCSASWHRQKRLKENIEFYKSVRNQSDALLVLGKNPDWIEKENNVFYLGHLPHDICLQIYSISDWFLHLAWLDHCPNVVVEALSQNCPVVCTNMGGTMEIVKDNGVVLIENNPYNFELTDYDKPYKLNLNASMFTLVKKEVIFDLNIEKITNQYIEVFNESLHIGAK
tara:strand:+ start:1229 stop:2161 length:933 start_codon:yes stop_codon:yes gene_type:complete